MRRLNRLTLFTILLLTSTFLGCTPTPPTVDNSGLKIEKIDAKTIDTLKNIKPFEIMEKDGVEFKVSRDAAGKFGGSFFTTSPGRGPKTFNPLAAKDGTSSSIGGLMFVGLVETDAYTGQLVPHLAKSFEILPDNVTTIVTLRKGLTWSDGEPLSADDVVFTWNKIILQGLGNPSMRDILTIDGQLPTVRKLDNLRIEFKTPVPFAPFHEQLSNPIFPKHIVEPVIRNNAKAFDSFWGVNTNPKDLVVNGPFRLEEYQSGQRIVLKRNPKYFMVNKEGQRLPYLARYVIEFVQDSNAEFLLFQQDRIDLLSVPGSQVFELRHLQGPSFRMYDLGPASGSQFLVLNLNPRRNKETGKPYVKPYVSAWFRDKNFREALDYAIDRDSMVKNILRGVGQPLFTAESLSSVYLNKSIAAGHPRDLEKAKTLLKSSGFHWNKDQQLIDKTNHRVEFELMTNAGNLERESTGVQVKNDLAELGIKVNFRAIDFNVLVGRIDTAEWEGVILGLTGSNTEPHGGKNVWDSTGALHLMNQRHPELDMPGSDVLEPWEAELNKLFNEGAKTIGFENRKKFYDRYQAVIYENAIMLYLYSPKSILAVRKRIQNYDPTPLSSLHNIESIWVK